jgi:MutS domain V
MSLPSAALLHYQGRLQDLQGRLSDGLGKQTEALVLLGAIAFIFVIVSFFALARRNLPVWSPLLCVPPLAWVTRSLGRRRSDLHRLQRLHQFQEQGVRRLEHRWQGSGDYGAEFEPANHSYSHDLNLFGKGSLFELLCTVRTRIGQRLLASYLLDPPEIDETIRRQEAVQELTGRKTLREQVALLGSHDKQQSSWDTFARWLDSPPEPFHKAARIVAAVLSCAAAILGLIALLGVAPAHFLIGALIAIVACEALFALVWRKRVRRIVADMQLVGVELGVLRHGLELLPRQNFNSVKLRQIAAQIGSDAAARVRHLERLATILDERHKDWFYYPSLLLLVGTQTAMAIEHWRAAHRADFLVWMGAWGEFEALSALACYAFERQETTRFPELSGPEAVFEAQGLGHPLLSSDERVANDFVLNAASRFYVISGSNMAGKSTLLRAIGANAVLAMAGAPVTAQKLRVSPFKVCASISIADSLLEGKSKFLAEVERLRDAIEATNEARPVLFLIDEIFGGTNSRDRRAAAEAVIRTLIERGALGAVSTHDLALTEIADAAGLGGANVHMASRHGTDVLDFDYLLKTGVTPEANAKAIARLSGVPV